MAKSHLKINLFNFQKKRKKRKKSHLPLLSTGTLAWMTSVEVIQVRLYPKLMGTLIECLMTDRGTFSSWNPKPAIP
jgi:hypothetical protein